MPTHPEPDELRVPPAPPPAPEPLVIHDATARIRAAHQASGRRYAVLDDDPTGSQAVHDVDVVTVFDRDQYAAGLDAAGATCFVLTNTRSMSEPDAVALTTEVAKGLLEVGRDRGVPLEIVSRSDSTLRGHVTAEVRAVDRAHRSVTGRGYDGVLVVPAYFEAGRFTAGDVHWARVAGEPLPVGATEFAQDATFGYRASNLREFVAEKSGGSVRAEDVRSLTLDDIRRGGPDRVEEVLRSVTGGTFVVVNATEYADLEVVVLGLLAAQEAGRSFLYRTGPSFVRALAGMDAAPPLTSGDLWARGGPESNGLVVVGSHVGLTNRQVARARERGGLVEVELDVPSLVDPERRDEHVREVSERVRAALAAGDVLLSTSRTLLRGEDGGESLSISRKVSTSLTEVVRAALPARPSWVVAKGGITSHDLAVRGLRIRRARVLGQLLPGMVSVLSPVDAAAEAVGMPFVVFAGNVGDEETLAEVVALCRGERGPTTGPAGVRAAGTTVPARAGAPGPDRAEPSDR